MPEWTEHLRLRLAFLRLNPAREAEIVEELSQHLDQRYDELRRGGTSVARRWVRSARRSSCQSIGRP
jgi:putative ABC transport system permease protein